MQYSMGFKLTTPDGISIRFLYYLSEAPITCQAFNLILPFEETFYHARVSGQEIWIDNLPEVVCIQENASVFTFPGEVVLGPSKPARVRTAGCLGIYYGEGKGLDAANIFAKVSDEDSVKLMELGNVIWKQGAVLLRFESLS